MKHIFNQCYQNAIHPSYIIKYYTNSSLSPYMYVFVVHRNERGRNLLIKVSEKLYVFAVTNETSNQTFLSRNHTENFNN